MFGFKRKKEEDTMALVLKKENIFSRIASFFRRNKQEELGEYYSNQVFYSRHSDVINAINNAGEEVFYGTVSMNGLDMYSFQRIKELGLIKDGNGQTTKLIVADLNQSYNQEGLEPQNLRKICFEIPTYYSLEEFLYNDGLYQLVQSGRVDLNRLNYYEVTPVGKADMSTDSAMQTYVAIGNNTPEAIAYADKKLTKDWVEQINRDRKEQAKLRKQANKKMVDDMYEQALIDEENFEKREMQEQENRINDNNIRVAPGKDSIYFTDPDTGKIIYLDRIVKVNTIIHRADDQISNLYIAKYTAKRNSDDVQNLATQKSIAFELTDEEMNNILKNDDDRLNFTFRSLFSERNVRQYIDRGELGSRHIGFLKKTIEGYKILLGCNSSRNYLNSLNLELYNSQVRPGPTYFGYGEGR
jgi:thymidine kinase